jgi:6-phosphogluconate dehydrogenase
MVGLGRMGANMAERLREDGHDVIGYDRDPNVSQVASLAELVAKLDVPRVVWVMVPAGASTEETIGALASLLASGDVIVDGGNSNFRDSIRRATDLGARGVDLLDVGTSGGIWGRTEGFCLMVGGNADAFARVEPVFGTLAPANGVAHVGPSGAGHFVKMVHNGIEYAMLQSYAEGFEVLEASKVFPDLDLYSIAELWRNGSVVRSWLLDLAARALEADPELAHVKGWVADSGEGRWTILEAIEEDVPVPAIAAALFARFSSRQDDSFAMKMIAALRNQFGGHTVRSE